MKKTKKKNRKVKAAKLSVNEKLFVRHMTRIGYETFNNATWSYIAVYKPNIETLSKESPYDMVDGLKVYGKSPYQKTYDICRTEASKYFAKPHIRDAIDKRMLEMFGEDDKADLRHAQLMFQTEDLQVSLAALRDRNKLKKRIGSDEPSVPLGAQPITHVQIVMPNAPGGRANASTKHS